MQTNTVINDGYWWGLVEKSTKRLVTTNKTPMLFLTREQARNWRNEELEEYFDAVRLVKVKISGVVTK